MKCLISGKLFIVVLTFYAEQGNFTVEEQRAREKFELQAKEKMESIKLVIITFQTIRNSDFES